MKSYVCSLIFHVVGLLLFCHSKCVDYHESFVVLRSRLLRGGNRHLHQPLPDTDTTDTNDATDSRLYEQQ